MSLRFALLTAFLAGALATPGLAALDGRTLEGGTLEGGTRDTEIDRLMTVGKVPGLAMAVIENGKVAHVVAKGVRNERGDPLQADTIMYAASITKATFAYYVLMLVDDGKVDLDRSIAEVLPKPLPDYPRYADLGVDERWKTITLRRLLTHSSGLADQRFYDHLGYDPPFLKPPAYGASKAAVVNLTRYLATLWGPAGVRVNALSPGGVLGGQDAEFRRKFCERVPLGRMAEESDLVGPLLFLASDASAYVTGVELRVDGGFTAW